MTDLKWFIKGYKEALKDVNEIIEILQVELNKEVPEIYVNKLNLLEEMSLLINKFEDEELFYEWILSKDKEDLK